MAWMTAAGAGGAYWTENGAEYELTPSGAFHKLGPVPSDATGVVIGPDGTLVRVRDGCDQPQAATSNRIVVVRPGGSAKVIADQVSDPNNPDAERRTLGLLPGQLDRPRDRLRAGADRRLRLRLVRHADAVRVLGDHRSRLRGCDHADRRHLVPAQRRRPRAWSRCASPAPTATDAIRIASDGTVVHTYALSGKNVAGDALFSADGSQLAYVTIPVAERPCGATINATLRVMNIATGQRGQPRRSATSPRPRGRRRSHLRLRDQRHGTDTWLVARQPGDTRGDAAHPERRRRRHRRDHVARVRCSR